MSINRRRLLSTALAVPAGASVTFPQSRSPAPGGGGDDAALLAAERRVAALRAQKAALSAAAETAGSYTGEFEDTIIAPLSDEQYALQDYIHRTPCATLVGAAVKLRQLAAAIAVRSGEEETDAAWVSTRQVVALIELELAGAAAAA
jgi:hypothetical protein